MISQDTGNAVQNRITHLVMNIIIHIPDWFSQTFFYSTLSYCRLQAIREMLELEIWNQIFPKTELLNPRLYFVISRYSWAQNAEIPI